jgi:hypothetical protein
MAWPQFGPLCRCALECSSPSFGSKRQPANGPLRSLVRPLCGMPTPVQARQRAGSRRGLTSAVPATRGLPCAARSARAAAELALPRARCARPGSELKQSSPTRRRAAGNPRVPALLGASDAPRRLPAHCLAAAHRCCCARHAAAGIPGRIGSGWRGVLWSEVKEESWAKPNSGDMSATERTGAPSSRCAPNTNDRNGPVGDHRCDSIENQAV